MISSFCDVPWLVKVDDAVEVTELARCRLDADSLFFLFLPELILFELATPPLDAVFAHVCTELAAVLLGLDEFVLEVAMAVAAAIALVLIVMFMFMFVWLFELVGRNWPVFDDAVDEERWFSSPPWWWPSPPCFEFDNTNTLPFFIFFNKKYYY